VVFQSVIWHSQEQNFWDMSINTETITLMKNAIIPNSAVFQCSHSFPHLSVMNRDEYSLVPSTNCQLLWTSISCTTYLINNNYDLYYGPSKLKFPDDKACVSIIWLQKMLLMIWTLSNLCAMAQRHQNKQKLLDLQTLKLTIMHLNLTDKQRINKMLFCSKLDNNMTHMMCIEFQILFRCPALWHTFWKISLYDRKFCDTV